MRKIILASSSPRRKKFFTDLFGNNFMVHPSTYEENNNLNIPPEKLAEKHAYGKAKEVASHYKEGVVIAADAFVVLDNKVLGKPKDEEDAFRMLKAQSGKWTKVISGLAVIDIDNNKEYVEHETTKVKMAVVSDDEIKAYIKTKDPLDKAGAFGIQDKGTIFVEKIEGCYSNVVGLPLPRLHKILRKLKIQIFSCANK
jgi:septum formation protein